MASSSSAPIKNRAAAEIQITAEQLVNEARTMFPEASRGGGGVAPTLVVADKEEMNSFLQMKRKEFETRIRKNRLGINSYVQYAKFEAEQMDFRRVRAIMERGIAVLGMTEPRLWTTYAELEAKAGFVNHALNVMNRAVEILPRHESLWFKYLEYEIILGDDERTRGVFEKFMTWEPSEEAWATYIRFEEKRHQTDRARDVYERYCGLIPTAKAYIKFAKWEEMTNRLIGHARTIFERAAGVDVMAELPEGEKAKPDLWLAFAAFEARQNEHDRVRAVYQYALQLVTQTNERQKVFAAFAAFEKRFGGGADAIVTERRRHDYEAAVSKDAMDYDAWFDLIRLEESICAAAADDDVMAVSRVRDVYVRAESHPPTDRTTKSPEWRRFIFLFIYEALFEELIVKDQGRARLAYRKALDLIPHKVFTFSKLWILAASLELRARDLTAARKLMGACIGCNPKDKSFRFYIQLELLLGQVDRCRLLYEKYLKWAPHNSHAWSKFAEMEAEVGEDARARAIFELGVNQPVLDEPEKLWLRFIDFETTRVENAEQGVVNAKILYERLLERTEGHVKVYMAFAKFLAMCDSFGPNEARRVLRHAETSYKARGDVESRVTILNFVAQLEKKLVEVDMEGASVKELELAERWTPKKVEDLATGELIWLFPKDVEEEAAKKALEDEAPEKVKERAAKAAAAALLSTARDWANQKKMRLAAASATATALKDTKGQESNE